MFTKVSIKEKHSTINYSIKYSSSIQCSVIVVRGIKTVVIKTPDLAGVKITTALTHSAFNFTVFLSN